MFGAERKIGECVTLETQTSKDYNQSFRNVLLYVFIVTVTSGF